MGRVELKQGSASSFPTGTDSLGKCVPSTHIITCLTHRRAEGNQACTETGGLLLLGLRMKHPTRTFIVAPGFTPEEIKQVLELLRTAGLGNIRNRKAPRRQRNNLCPGQSVKTRQFHGCRSFWVIIRAGRNPDCLTAKKMDPDIRDIVQKIHASPRSGGDHQHGRSRAGAHLADGVARLFTDGA